MSVKQTLINELKGLGIAMLFFGCWICRNTESVKRPDRVYRCESQQASIVSLAAPVGEFGQAGIL